MIKNFNKVGDDRWGIAVACPIPLVTTGLLIGTLVIITGMGGAALTTPLLLFFGVGPSVAVGSSLLFNILNKGLSSLIYAKKGFVEIRVLVKLLSGGSIGVVLGYAVLSLLVKSQTHLIVLGIGLVLVISSLLQIYRIMRKSTRPRKSQKYLMGASVVTGLAVGVTSIGAGSLLMTFLLESIESPRRAVATDITFGFFISLLSIPFYILSGRIDYGVVIALVAGSLLGVPIGMALSGRISKERLRLVLSFMILVVGLYITSNAVSAIIHAKNITPNI